MPIFNAVPVLRGSSREPCGNALDSQQLHRGLLRVESRPQAKGEEEKEKGFGWHQWPDYLLKLCWPVIELWPSFISIAIYPNCSRSLWASECYIVHINHSQQKICCALQACHKTNHSWWLLNATKYDSKYSMHCTMCCLDSNVPQKSQSRGYWGTLRCSRADTGVYFWENHGFWVWNSQKHHFVWVPRNRTS